MKRLHFQIGICLILLTGCSQIDSYIKKVPFINHSDQNGLAQSNQGQASELTLEAAYFNQIEEVAGKSVIQNPMNILALVNKQYALPANYEPKDLIRPHVRFSFGKQEIEKSYLRKEAAGALERMFASAKKSGIELLAVSGYRSYIRQKDLYNAEVEKVGEEHAIQAVAVPGNSEHQTGLSMDISSESVNNYLTEEFDSTAEGKWLERNAHRFGFILRYPKGKEDITGYQFEPWHFRYVGEKAATLIYEKKWTLEEYFHVVKKM
ncbi:M15 family metallopeptidase [Bacillus sp. DNRA2]|uniref:M15 family metallopeptidase n=1 Tax=Bacillus sp. DNRA2 TaxID=2723053 RepID=UPI00145F149C|nr:M15 family metallopeptidase [Bacillus sp. DNRA2]NMD69999.1 M15 family metallopeptidase [Bacillus sp. DNRA2]